MSHVKHVRSMQRRWQTKMIIEIILNVGKFILDLATSGIQANKAKKAQIADDLIQISELLEKVATSLEQDVCAFKECAAVNIATESLIEKIRESVDPELIKLLEENMMDCTLPEKLTACQNRKESAKRLKTASGRFLAAGLLAKY